MWKSEKEATYPSFKEILGNKLKNLKNLVLNCNRSVLSVLNWCEKEAYSATGVENSLRLFNKSWI